MTGGWKRNAQRRFPDKDGLLPCNACGRLLSEHSFKPCRVAASKGYTTRYSHCRTCVALKKHRVDFSFYLALREQQAGLCPVCEEPLPQEDPTIPRRLFVLDHDHRCCGKDRLVQGRTCGSCVRGILHGKCNLLVGAAENPLIKSALDYVRNHIGKVQK